jgi:hypothetical protein
VRWTAEQEASYALDYRLSRDDLRPEVRAEYDRLLAERIAAAVEQGVHIAATGRVIPPRSSPEVRARLLQLIKQANPKYAKPFEKDRIAAFSLVGTESWAEYGQVVLQMAILDTLLSIEELLTKANDGSGRTDHNEAEQP